MAAPVITINYNDGTEGTPTWTEIVASSSINFTGPDTVDGTMDPITRPAVGVRVADELWIVTTGTDVQVSLYDGGGQEVADFVTDVFTANPTNTNILAIQASTDPETSAGVLRAWDDNTYSTTGEESIDGTSNMVESFWRACETDSNVADTGARTGSIPANYLTMTANETEFALEGTTYELQFTTALSAGNINVFLLHLLIPDDATNPAVAARTISLTYHYFYT